MIKSISLVKMVSQGLFLLCLCITWCYQCKAHAVNDKVDLITETCKKTDYFDICVKTLRANPRSVDSDVNGLAIIILDEAHSYSNTTYTMINDLITKTSDKDTKELLSICSEMYDTALTRITEAIQLLTVRPLPDYRYIESIVEGVGEYATSCEGGFHEDAKKSPLTARNKRLYLLSEVAVEIVESIH